MCSAKELLPDLLTTWEGGVAALVKEKGLEAITDPAVIEALVKEVIAENQDKVQQYKGGKNKLLGFFVGQVCCLLRQYNAYSYVDT